MSILAALMKTADAMDEAELLEFLKELVGAYNKRGPAKILYLSEADATAAAATGVTKVDPTTKSVWYKVVTSVDLDNLHKGAFALVGHMVGVSGATTALKEGKLVVIGTRVMGVPAYALLGRETGSITSVLGSATFRDAAPLYKPGDVMPPTGGWSDGAAKFKSHGLMVALEKEGIPTRGGPKTVSSGKPVLTARPVEEW